MTTEAKMPICIYAKPYSCVFEATNETRYLKRAKQLAETFTVKLAAHSQQFVWEHYNKNWQIDLDYNKDDPQHLFRPWGFQQSSN